MKTYKASKRLFIGYMIADALLIWVFGLGLIMMLYHYINYKNNTLSLGEKSLILKQGVLNTSTHEIPYKKINSITVSKTMLANMGGYGTISIFSGNDVSGVHFKDIEKPEEVRNEIYARMEAK